MKKTVFAILVLCVAGWAQEITYEKPSTVRTDHDPYNGSDSVVLFGIKTMPTLGPGDVELGFAAIRLKGDRQPELVLSLYYSSSYSSSQQWMFIEREPLDLLIDGKPMSLEPYADPAREIVKGEDIHGAPFLIAVTEKMRWKIDLATLRRLAHADKLQFRARGRRFSVERIATAKDLVPLAEFIDKAAQLFPAAEATGNR